MTSRSMRSRLRSFVREHLVHFSRFVKVGILGSGIYFLFYSGLLALGAHYLAAAWIAWFIAFCVIFEFNRSFTFRYSGGFLGAFIRGLGVYAFQQVVMTGMLWTGVEVLGVNEFLAFLFALPPAVAVSFFGLKLFAFASFRSPAESPDSPPDESWTKVQEPSTRD